MRRHPDRARRVTGAHAGPRGYALPTALLVSALCAVLALQAFTRAQVDMRLARQLAMRTRADLAADDMLRALVDDLRSSGGAAADLALPRSLCPAVGRCAEYLPRVQALREQLPGGMHAALELHRDGTVGVVRLPEVLSSSARLYRLHALEARVQLSGAAAASTAAALVWAVEQPAGEAGR